MSLISKANAMERKGSEKKKELADLKNSLKLAGEKRIKSV